MTFNERETHRDTLQSCESNAKILKREAEKRAGRNMKVTATHG